MADVVHCPSFAEWQRLASGACSDEEASRLRRHLEQCPRCAAAVHPAAGSDPGLPAFRGAKGDTIPSNLRESTSDLTAHISGEEVVSDQTLALLLQGGDADEDPSSEVLDQSTLNVPFQATAPPPEAANYLAPAKAPGEIGRLGHYRVLKVIGLRGLGIVFQAEDPHLKRQVAIKALRPSMAVSPKARERFIREAQLTAKLEHDHLVEIHEAGEDRGVLFLAMQLLQGESLEQRLKREPKLPAAEVVRIGREIAEGLAAAHEHGLVHQDVRPATIWLETFRGRVKILDFGLARALDRDMDGTQKRPSSVVSPYEAPEQREGQPVDFRADLFSLGCVLHHMATGHTPELSLDAALNVTAARPDLPAGVAGLIGRLLDASPQQRPTSTRVVVQALEACANLRTTGSTTTDAAVSVPAPVSPTADDDEKSHLTAILVEPPPPRAPSGVPGRRRRLLAALLSLACVAGIVTAIILTRKGNDDSSGPPPVVPGESPLDALRREDIPADVLTAFGRGDAVRVLPEVVAILGYSQLREPLAVLNEPNELGAVRDLAFSPDGNYFVTVGIEPNGPRGDVKLWDAKTSKLVRAFPGHEAGVMSVAFSPDSKLLATAGRDKLVKVWDIKTGELENELIWHTNVVSGVVFSKDGKRIATCSHDETVRLWDAVTGKEEFALKGHEGHVTSVVLHPDDKRLASAGADKTVRIWDLEQKKVVKALTGHAASVANLAFSRDGRWLASAGMDGLIKIWDVDNGEEAASLPAHTNGVHSVAFSPDGELLVSAGGQENLVKVWSTGSWRHLLVFRWHETVINRAVFSHDGRRVASAGNDRTAAFWDPRPPREAFDFPGHTGPVLALSLSPDQKRLASGGADGTVKVWDLTSGKVLHSLTGHKKPVRAVLFSPDGAVLASGGDDELIHVWDALEPAEPRVWKGHTGAVLALAVTKDGKTLTSASADRSIQMWDIGTGRRGRTLSGNQDRITSIAYHPRGDQLASGGGEGVVKLWDIGGGGVLANLTGHRMHVAAVAVSSDGRLLASAGADRDIRLWDADTNKEINTLAGHFNEVTSLAFRPDGAWLASASKDGNVRLWPVAGDPPPKAVCPLQVPDVPVHAVQVAADGRHLLAANDDGTIVVIRLATRPPGAAGEPR